MHDPTLPFMFGAAARNNQIRGNEGGFMRGNRVYAGWTPDAWDAQRAVYEARMDVVRRERRQRRGLRHRMARVIQAYYRNYRARTVIDMTHDYHWHD